MLVKMEEIWKPILENKFLNLYEVSNLGRIKSLHKNFYKKSFLTPILTKDGYYIVQLNNKGFAKQYFIHGLVLNTFYPKKEINFKKYQCNHIDGIKTNNNLNNLEWLSCSENRIHAKKLKLWSRLGEKNTYAKLTEKNIKEIRNSNNKNKELAKKYNVTPQHIRLIKNNGCWKHLK